MVVVCSLPSCGLSMEVFHGQFGGGREIEVEMEIRRTGGRAVAASVQSLIDLTTAVEHLLLEQQEFCTFKGST